MSNKGTQILTPVGRLVMGDCFTPQTTDAEGRPLVIKTGPNAGQPRVDFYMGIAIPKTDAGYNDLYATIYNEARVSFPNLFDASGQCLNPKFAFKIIDGDSQIPNSKGNKPCDREGFVGHWILNFSGGYAPKCYVPNNGDLSLATDPAMIKRGYYVRICGSVKGNGSQQQPGIFLNHSMVELVGYGEEIITGPDANAVFGAAPAALPQGASATPLAPVNTMMAPPANMMPPAGMATTNVIAPPPLNTMAPPPPANTMMPPTPGSVAPAPDFLDPSLRQVNSNGQVYTVGQLTEAGYTAEAIAALPAA